MQFSAAIAVHASCDRHCLLLGSFYFTSASCSDDAPVTDALQEQLIPLKLLNESIIMATC